MRHLVCWDGLQSESSCTSWLCHWGHSSCGSWGTLPSSGHTDTPGSLAFHRSSTSRSPHALSCSNSDRSGSRCSRCRIHTCVPGSSCPRRRWSGGRHVSDNLVLTILHPSSKCDCTHPAHLGTGCAPVFGLPWNIYSMCYVMQRVRAHIAPFYTLRALYKRYNCLVMRMRSKIWVNGSTATHVFQKEAVGLHHIKTSGSDQLFTENCKHTAHSAHSTHTHTHRLTQTQIKHWCMIV